MIPQDAVRRRNRNVGLIDNKLSVLNRVHGCPVAVNYYSTYYVWWVIDNNDATSWISSWTHALNPWIYLDLGVPRTVCKIRVYQPTDVSKSTQFKLEVSNDLANWYLAYTTAAGLAVGEQVFYVPLLKYQIWRLTSLAGGAFGWDMSSFELFGAAI
jgi:hypothetical protein